MNIVISTKFLTFFVLLSWSKTNLVSSSRTLSSEAHSGGGGGSSSSSSSSSSSGTSLLPTHRERGDLISSQFRAVVERDLDTSESSLAGMDNMPSSPGHGLDEDHLGMNKYMDVSASAYAPSKLRMTQTGFYDPYPTYAGAYNSVPSSYYPFNAYGYRDKNPMVDVYPPYYERDRIRNIRERAMQASQSAPYTASSTKTASSNRDGYGGSSSYFRSTDLDSLAMSSGHDEHAHGWGPPKEYTSKVNTNAIGLLGLIGLLSLLSNVLMQFTTTTTTTTTAAAKFKHKRSTDQEDENKETKEQRMERIFMEILPHLTPVAHAKDGVLPLECIFHGVCMTNKVLVNELGVHGRPAGIRISTAIIKLLEKVGSREWLNKKDASDLKKYSSKNNFKKSLELAGLLGRNKKDCERSYPVCSALQGKDVPALPFIIRMQDLPHLVSKVSRMSAGSVPMNL